MSGALSWLTVVRGDAPLIISMPHTGTDLDGVDAASLVSEWLARGDADWWVDRLYDFAHGIGATVVRTSMSRTVIDCNRDPTGKSLYPGQNTTELCPTATFDGEPLYAPARAPGEREIASRRRQFFDPYHAAIAAEIDRLRQAHDSVVLFDAHSIRSRIPRLFEGELPHFNIGTNSGASCSPALTYAVEAVCSATNFTHVTNGRFKGGYTTRHYGAPAAGVHAIQLELAMRAYIDEPEEPTPANWPVEYNALRADDLRRALERILHACIRFANEMTR